MVMNVNVVEDVAVVVVNVGVVVTEVNLTAEDVAVTVVLCEEYPHTKMTLDVDVKEDDVNDGTDDNECVKI